MVSLAVSDLQRSIAFYQQGLGLPRLQSPPEVAFFNLNGSWLGLCSRHTMAAEAGVEFAADRTSGRVAAAPVALAHNVSTQAGVDSIVAAAASAGAVVTRQPAATVWGGYSGYFTDPDGHLWEVAYNPFLWIGPEDPPVS